MKQKNISEKALVESITERIEILSHTATRKSNPKAMTNL